MTSVLSDGEGILKTLKCRRNRYVRALRPPPGGAQALTIVESSMLFHVCFCLSKKPPISRSCRRSSMHGCAPNCSRAGILISSMKMAIYSLGRAPQTDLPFLLSFDSIASCVYWGVVCAEKFTITELMFSRDFSSTRRFCTTMDLPTPVLPVIRMGFCICSSSWKEWENFTVSVVGTIN